MSLHPGIFLRTAVRIAGSLSFWPVACTSFSLPLGKGYSGANLLIMSLKARFIPTSSDVERYKRLRQLAKDLNHKIVKTVPREAMHEIGDALGILRDGTLVFGTEDEPNILMDCCLYDWIRNGKNIVEKYAEDHPSVPGTEEGELLQAYLQGEIPGSNASIVREGRRRSGRGPFIARRIVSDGRWN
jgi:hypothetical protein